MKILCLVLFQATLPLSEPETHSHLITVVQNLTYKHTHTHRSLPFSLPFTQPLRVKDAIRDLQVQEQNVFVF